LVDIVDIFDDEEKTDLTKVAALVGEQVSRTARESVELIQARNLKENRETKYYGSFEYLAKTKPPDRRAKEVLNGGAVVFGGGSKSGRKRSKIPPKATVWSWYEL